MGERRLSKAVSGQGSLWLYFLAFFTCFILLVTAIFVFIWLLVLAPGWAIIGLPAGAFASLWWLLQRDPEET